MARPTGATAQCKSRSSDAWVAHAKAVSNIGGHGSLAAGALTARPTGEPMSAARHKSRSSDDWMAHAKAPSNVWWSRFACDRRVMARPHGPRALLGANAGVAMNGWHMPGFPRTRGGHGSLATGTSMARPTGATARCKSRSNDAWMAHAKAPPSVVGHGSVAAGISTACPMRRWALLRTGAEVATIGWQTPRLPSTSGEHGSRRCEPTVAATARPRWSVLRRAPERPGAWTGR